MARCRTSPASGRDAGVSAPTARRWLNLLVTSRLVLLLPPYHRNFGKRLRKSPKLHVIDPGLASWSLGYRTTDAIMNGPALGALTESAVVSELTKAIHHGGGAARLYHWEGLSAKVDIVADVDGQLYGIEVKATRTPTPRHADRLAAWCELTGARGPPRLPDRPRPAPRPRRPRRAVALLRVRIDRGGSARTGTESRRLSLNASVRQILSPRSPDPPSSAH